jgi:hypothetical protein
MKTDSSVCFHAAMIWGFLVLALAIMDFCFVVTAQNTPPTDCPPTPPAQCSNPATTTRAQAWLQGAHVTVNIDPSFTPEKQRAIEQAVQNWQGAGSSGVTFTITHNSTPPSMTPPAGTYNAQIWNRNPLPNCPSETD